MKTIKLISWNVNGLRSILKKGFLDVVKKEKPDILCLQETKAEQSQVVLDLPEYEEYWHSSSKKKGYSGTAMFTKIKPIAVVNGFPAGIQKKYNLTDERERNADGEGRVIAAEFDRFFVVTVYTPNAKPDLSRLAFRHKHWDPAFLAYMKLLQKKKPVIFCGDLNVAHEEIDLARPEDNVGEHGFTDEEREGFGKMIQAGFVDTFRSAFPKKTEAYTWWSHWANARTRNVGWRIDYFLVSKEFQKHVKKAFILADVLGSDHCPVGIILEI